MIEVACICGKRYEVPPDKAGKKLQCRRCGAVQRIPRPEGPRPAPPAAEGDVVVPFHVPDDEDEDGAGDLGGSIAPIAAPEPSLDLRDAARRCPTCGLQDDASVVVCVRCGYDWRAGKRLEDAWEAGERSTRLRRIAGAQAEVDRLQRVAWWALTPAGIVLGPWLVARTLPLRRELQAFGEGRAVEVLRIRATAVAGCLAWLVALAGLAVSLGGRPEPAAALHATCAARLGRAGAALRAKAAAAGRFPPAGAAWGEALEGLARTPGSGLAAEDLRCPVSQDLYPYRRRDEELLTPRVAPDYLVLWDREPHVDDAGLLAFRAVRADGSIERFFQRSDLEAATRRRPFAGASMGPAAGATEGAPRGGGGAGQGTRDAGPVRVDAFLRLAESVDDTDPDFAAGAALDPERFTERVGVPPLEALPHLLAAGQPAEVRQHAARALARLTLPAERALALAAPLVEDDDPDVRFGASMTLRRHGDPAWLAACASVVDEAKGEARTAAVRWVGRHAAKGPDELRAVLELAAERRRTVGAAGADAMLPLPEDVLPAVAALVGDPRTGREARAVLYTAGEAGARAALKALASPDAALRRAVFEALDLLRGRGAVTLEDYLRRAGEEPDLELRAAAVARLAQGEGPAPPALLAWALDQGRASAGAAAPLRELVAAVLARATDDDGLQRLVADLAGAGDHGPVLASLRAPARDLDERVDVQLARALARIRDVGVRLEVVRLLTARVHEVSLRGLLAAADDPSEEVRIEALRGLNEADAVRGDDLRREVARVVGQRLRSEESPRALEQLHALATGALYCSVDLAGDEHRCSPALIRALEPLVRKGDQASMAAFSTHPNERNVAFLISAVDGASEEDRRDLALTLGQMTGVLLRGADASQWRKVLVPLPVNAAQTLASRAAAGNQAARARIEAAQQRLAQLRAERQRQQ